MARISFEPILDESKAPLSAPDPLAHIQAVARKAAMADRPLCKSPFRCAKLVHGCTRAKCPYFIPKIAPNAETPNVQSAPNAPNKRRGGRKDKLERNAYQRAYMAARRASAKAAFTAIGEAYKVAFSAGPTTPHEQKNSRAPTTIERPGTP